MLKIVDLPKSKELNSDGMSSVVGGFTPIVQSSYQEPVLLDSSLWPVSYSVYTKPIRTSTYSIGNVSVA